MLVFFITWLVGYVFMFLTFINTMVETDTLTCNNVIHALLISLFSWLIAIAFVIIYLYEKLSQRRHNS